MAAEEYWLQRNIDNEEAMHRKLDGKERVILNAYQQSQDYLNKQIKRIYDRYLNRSGLNEEEVSKILNTSAAPADLAELGRLSKDIKDKSIKKDVTNYLTGLSVKHRITLLEDLKAKSYIVAKQIADVQLEVQTDFYIDTIHESYNEAANEAIIGQTEKKITITNKQYPKFVSSRSQDKLEIRDTNTDKIIKTVNLSPDVKVPDFKELSTKYVKNILESDWKGSNYSKRLWDDTELLAKRLEELFTVKNLTGMSEAEMTKTLAKEFNTSMYVARRLIRTESNYMAGQAKLKGWKEHGVDEYILIAVLDMLTSLICRTIDGKVHKVVDAVVNGKDGTFPPFHPWCRTIAAAYFGERTLDGKRNAIDRVDGKAMTIDQRTNYKQWEDMLIKKHGKRNVEVARKKAKSYTADLNQVRRYKNVLKDDAPKTLDEFQELKYNSKTVYEEMKKKYKSLKT